MLLGILDVFRSLAVGIHADPQEYQTLIGGGLALLGVLITLWVSGRRFQRQLSDNAKQNSLNHKREADTRKQAVTGALLAELSVMSRFLRHEEVQARKFIDPNWQTIEEAENLKFDDREPIPDPTKTTEKYRFAMPARDIVYRAMVPQISALDHETISGIIAAYDRYYLLRSWILENDISDVSTAEVSLFHMMSVSKLERELSETRTEIDISIAKLSPS